MKKYTVLLLSVMSVGGGLLSCATASNSDMPLAGHQHELAVNPFIRTAPSEAHTAGLFGKGTEELGQTLPAVLEPNGMNFWTPQTRDTEQKCVAPYYYTDSLLHGFRNSHWIVGGCTQDYGSMTLMPLFGKLCTTPTARASRMDKNFELAHPSYYCIQLHGV